MFLSILIVLYLNYIQLVNHIHMLSSFARRCFSSKKIQVGSLVQVSEFDRPTDIITHCPSIETGFPFHLSAFLYEHPPNPEEAVKCHDMFRKTMQDISGARVWTVREILSQFSPEELRNFLIDFSTINFLIAPGKQPEELRHKEQRQYIEYSLSNLSISDLIDLILLHPSISIDVGESSSGFNYNKIPLSPLANLTFTRDQQITTAKGVVIGRFGAIQRKPENDLMAAVWPQIGVNPIGRIKNPGTVEGGDFIILGEDAAMLGVGLRTNMAAAEQLMKEDLLGTRRFIVVEDKKDLDQQRMHLDTYFNVVEKDLCVCVDKIAEDDPKYIRIAHEYVKTEKGYVLDHSMPFGKWLQKEKFTVVKASFKQQEGYFLNLLHLGRNNSGKSQILAINPDVEKAVKDVGFNGDVTYIDFSPITSMYGGVHCASQVLRAHE
ncbi:Amidinotransferase family protein [Tritrichomonas foetus]|uniref:Amidinotransferase family protein n=1 Tax=Tritrichomonas foetus TaxID=1144522 RepID=A0A1J4KAZ6_9EUKA|nr:Amidinotransferase family protein [Tritrichomonas foetus]|eukprot:OHT06876.1 Amidinotransferase family protein [Tritrichomonas foetus]